MRQVDRHANVVHALHDVDAEFAQAAVRPLELAIADPALAGIRQTGQTDADAVQHVHPVQLVVYRQVLHRRQESDFARLPRIQDVLRAADFHHGVAAFVDVGQHHSDFVHQIAEAAERRVRLLAQAGQQIGRGHCRPTSGFDGVEAPGIGVRSKVRRQLGGVVGQHHRVLMDVDQDQIVHESPKAQLLRGVQWHTHGRYAADLGRQRELRGRHQAGSVSGGDRRRDRTASGTPSAATGRGGARPSWRWCHRPPHAAARVGESTGRQPPGGAVVTEPREPDAQQTWASAVPGVAPRPLTTPVRVRECTPRSAAPAHRGQDR